MDILAWGVISSALALIAGCFGFFVPDKSRFGRFWFGSRWPWGGIFRAPGFWIHMGAIVIVPIVTVLCLGGWR